MSINDQRKRNSLFFCRAQMYFLVSFLSGWILSLKKNYTRPGINTVPSCYPAFYDGENKGRTLPTTVRSVKVVEQNFDNSHGGRQSAALVAAIVKNWMIQMHVRRSLVEVGVTERVLVWFSVF